MKWEGEKIHSVPSNVSRTVLFSFPANRHLHNPGKGEPTADIVNENNASVMLDHDIHKERLSLRNNLRVVVTREPKKSKEMRKKVTTTSQSSPQRIMNAQHKKKEEYKS